MSTRAWVYVILAFLALPVVWRLRRIIVAVALGLGLMAALILGLAWLDRAGIDVGAELETAGVDPYLSMMGGGALIFFLFWQLSKLGNRIIGGTPGADMFNPSNGRYWE